MAIAVISSGNHGFIAPATGVTFGITLSTGTMLIAGVLVGNDPGIDLTVRFNGVVGTLALSTAGLTIGNLFMNVYVWRNPPTGTNNIQFNWTSGTPNGIGLVWHEFTGVDSWQTSGNSAIAASTLTSVTDSLGMSTVLPNEFDLLYVATNYTVGGSASSAPSGSCTTVRQASTSGIIQQNITVMDGVIAAAAALSTTWTQIAGTYDMLIAQLPLVPTPVRLPGITQFSADSFMTLAHS